jgi:hypothetical protein
LFKSQNQVKVLGYAINIILSINNGFPHGRDRMVVEFTTTYEISAYYHFCSHYFLFKSQNQVKVLGYAANEIII